jgi:hypothetical protein
LQDKRFSNPTGESVNEFSFIGPPAVDALDARIELLERHSAVHVSVGLPSDKLGLIVLDRIFKAGDLSLQIPDSVLQGFNVIVVVLGFSGLRPNRFRMIPKALLRGTIRLF